MADGSGARLRMRYSFKWRLQAVRLVAASASMAEAARRQGTSRSKVQRWWCRYSFEGAAGLRERSSRPHLSPRRLTAAEAESATLRRATGTGPVARGAGPARPLAPGAGVGAELCARARRRAAARRHQEAESLLAARQGGAGGVPHAQPWCRLAVPALCVRCPIIVSAQFPHRLEVRVGVNAIVFDKSVDDDLAISVDLRTVRRAALGQRVPIDDGIGHVAAPIRL